MGATVARASRREIRRAFGPRALEQLADQDQALKVVCEILNRTFWGRLRWLLFGR